MIQNQKKTFPAVFPFYLSSTDTVCRAPPSPQSFTSFKTRHRPVILHQAFICILANIYDKTCQLTDTPHLATSLNPILIYKQPSVICTFVNASRPIKMTVSINKQICVKFQTKESVVWIYNLFWATFCFARKIRVFVFVCFTYCKM